MATIDNNYVLARSKEHKLILETIGELESVVRLSTKNDLVPQLKATMETFQKQILQHQYLEEKVIFQAALEGLASEKIVAMVLKLQKEHGIFTATVESIIYKIWNLDFDNQMLMRLSNELSGLAISLKKHSLIEVRELFPLLGSNPRCKQLIDKYSQAFVSIDEESGSKT